MSEPKCNLGKIASDFVKECVPGWFESCIWLWCPSKDGLAVEVHDLLGKARLLSAGTTITGGETASLKQCQYRDFAVNRDDYLDRSPCLGDMFALQDEKGVCVFEVRGRVDGRVRLPHWNWMGTRRCQMRVRTQFCREYTGEQWVEFRANNV